jgi:putative ABC transport system permease protein
MPNMNWGDLQGDVRYLVTSARRSRGFFLTAILTFGLGIGATTAMLSVAYGVLLRPLPYPDSDRIVQVWEEHAGTPASHAYPPLANTTFYAWRTRMQSLEQLGLFGPRDFTLKLAGESIRVHGAEVSPAVFDILRATPQLGRLFIAADDVPGHHDFVVLSDRLWRQRFGASPDIVGQSINVDGRLQLVVGVARSGFGFPERDTLMWTPFDDPTLVDPTTQGGVWMGNAIGRMKPGATLADVRSEGTAAARGIPRPPVLSVLLGGSGAVELKAKPLVSQQTDQVRPAILVLVAGVIIVLLVGCANVANLLLARGVARERELVLRAAIGASRRRLVRQLLTENFMLAAVGGTVGFLFAAGLIRTGVSLAGDSIPRLSGVAADGVTAFVAVALSIAVAAIAGLLPAWRATSIDLAGALRGADGATADGFRTRQSHALRRLLLISETALAVLLLVVASLIGRSFLNLLNVDQGYAPEGVLSVRTFPPDDTTPQRNGQFIAELNARLRADRRVVAAGAGNMMPFSDSITVATFDIPASIGNGQDAQTRAAYFVVTPGYAEALGLRLRSGRFLAEADVDAPVQKIVVNDEFVRAYLSPDRVLGLQLPPRRAGARPMEIVGVVAPQRNSNYGQTAMPEVYVAAPAQPAIGPEIDFVVRSTDNPAALSEVVRRLARDIDPSFVVGGTITLEHRIGESVRQPRMAAAAVSSLSVVTLLLAAVGVYGVLSYSVSQRSRELSVRAALGAERRSLVWMVVREGLAVAGIGAAVGLVAAAGLTRVMAAMLFGIGPFDPTSFIAAPLLLLPVVVLACVWPAAIAARTDPSRLLRE